MANMIKTLMQCECSLKSLVGFEISRELAETLVNAPVMSKNCDHPIGIISEVDFGNDKIKMNLWMFSLPEFQIDETGKTKCFNSITLRNETYEIEPRIIEIFDIPNKLQGDKQ